MAPTSPLFTRQEWMDCLEPSMDHFILSTVRSHGLMLSIASHGNQSKIPSSNHDLQGSSWPGVCLLSKLICRRCFAYCASAFPTDYTTKGGKKSYQSCSSLHFQCLMKSLALSRYSKDTCWFGSWINRWLKEGLHSFVSLLLIWPRSLFDRSAFVLVDTFAMIHVVSIYSHCSSSCTWLTNLGMEPIGMVKRILLIKNEDWGFPGGAVVENLPANAGDMGSSPGLGRSHMPWSN